MKESITCYLNFKVQSSSATHIFNINTMRMTSGLPMKTNRRSHDCIIMKENGSKIVYVGGGWDGSKLLSSMETMRLTDNEWKISSTVLPMPIKDFQFVKSNLPNRLFYLVGGTDSTDRSIRGIYALNNLETVLSWENVGSLTAPRGSHVTIEVPIKDIPGECMAPE